jgi:trinucleotide repeat-containing gene 6 protein
MPKLGSKTGSWSDSTADLWAAPTLNKTTGPPPGLGGVKNGSNNSSVVASESNDWIGTLGNWPPGTGAANAGAAGGNSGWFSTWLLLKNLTAQIDGSTLRTLCVQHGPLTHFHLYLNHGVALCKYNTREEAQKAQQALNNCVLGNTTICAESPSDGEVQNILAHLGVPSSSQSSAGGNGNGNGSGATSSTWRPPSQQGGPTRSGSDTWGSDWPIVNPSE